MKLKDIRNPEVFGKQYLELRSAGVPIEVAVRTHVEDYSHNPTCIDKYGRPGEAPAHYERIRVK